MDYKFILSKFDTNSTRFVSLKSWLYAYYLESLVYLFYFSL